MRARDVLGPESRLARVIDGYEDRPAQLAMADAVEAALDRGRPLMVEAGTGTGKTLAYLVPAVLSGKKVIISTATRALQEQIFAKDIPLVAEALAGTTTFRAALMKGLPNYLCRRRFNEKKMAGGGGASLRRIERWVEETQTGDRAELSDIAEDDPGWLEVQSSADTRIGASCNYFDECFVTRMRREAEDAQIVVVNHHLFLADLALRTGRNEGYAAVIPPYDAVIFDEAHQIEDIATDFFGSRVSSARVTKLTRDAERSFAAAGKLPMMKSGGIRGVLDTIARASTAFFSAFAAGRGPEARRVLAAADFDGKTMEAYGLLDAALRALEATAIELTKEEAIALVARRTADLRRDLHGIVAGARAGGGLPSSDGEMDPEARVAWIDVRERSVSIGASPIDLGPTLRAKLFDRVGCVVCTSATLATGDSFHFAKARLGAPPDIAELVVPSPFDFASRAALYLPRDLPEPAAPEFEKAATERIVELLDVTGGGAFVLCTSTRSMRALHRALGSKTKLPLLLQGEGPKHTLLAKFRASGKAVLVATMSFWEGVDVPGHALRLVIIDKIPFAVPSDPVVMARCQAIEQSGGNAFSQYSVPSAAITLKQGFGRLIRTQRDAGIVAVLDKRIVTKGYGRALIASLPPAQRVAEMDDVRAFWKGVDGL